MGASTKPTDAAAKTIPRGKRRIVLCLDGTWNEPERFTKAGDKSETTNVLKMVRAILPCAPDGADQIIYYDTGIGTQGPIGKIVGGGLGQGISKNIMQAYRFLANNYTGDEEIFLFGFSRGAYAARGLAGFIGAAGLLAKQHLAYVPEAYQLYRTPKDQRAASTYWKIKPKPGLNESVHQSAAEAVGQVFAAINGTEKRAWRPTKLIAALAAGLAVTR